MDMHGSWPPPSLNPSQTHPHRRYPFVRRFSLHVRMWPQGEASTAHPQWLGMKTDRIRTDITDIVFVFIFMSGFGFEYE
jgi:hypothetical protein